MGDAAQRMPKTDRQIDEASGSSVPCERICNVARWTTRFTVALLLLAFTGVSSVLAARHPSTVPAQGSGGSGQPEVRIAVTSMGYLPPGDLPAFYGYAEVSLHFVDATHLLFVFRVPRLLRRDHPCSGSNMERVVRAVVLDIPSGKIERMAEWKLYDVDDFLWGLGNGQFLLRECNRFDLLNASLDRQTLIEGSGSVDGIRFSPDRSMAVIEQTMVKTTPQPPTSPPSEKAQRNVDVEFVQFHPLKIIARARLQAPGSIPILDDGFLEALPAAHHRWVIELHPFHGVHDEERKVTTVRSQCMPWLTPLSHRVIAAGLCSGGDDFVFHGYDRQGRLLWTIPKGSRQLEPRFLLAPGGAHFAIESLAASHSIRSIEALSHKNVRGEKIEVYDTLTGTSIGSLLIHPEYTAGRNADFSPDGKRLAVLNQGAIEIYSLKQLTQAQ